MKKRRNDNRIALKDRSPLIPTILTKGGNKETNQPELRSADLERRERLAVGVHGRVEPQVLCAEAAPKGFVGDGGAEAGAGAGERRGGARPGLGNERVDDEPLHAFQPRRGRRRWIRRRR